MFSKTHFEWDPFSIFLHLPNASMTNKFQMPKEIFQFPINIRELVVYISKSINVIFRC